MATDVKFTILLTKELDQNLEKQKKLTGMSKGQLIRNALRHSFAMEFYNSPTCANGRACFVPQMHNPLQSQHPMAPEAK